MGRQILITGSGLGKTHMASLLAADYAIKGTPHRVVEVGSQAEVQELAPPVPGSCLIIVSNMMLEIAGKHQLITIYGR